MTQCCSHDTARAVLSYFEEYIQVSVKKAINKKRHG